MAKNNKCYIKKKTDESLYYFEPKIRYDRDGNPYLRHEDGTQVIICLLEKDDFNLPYWELYYEED